MPTFLQHLESLQRQADAAQEGPYTDRMDFGRVRDYQELAEQVNELRGLIIDKKAERVAFVAFFAGYLANRAELRHLSPELHAGFAVRSGGRKGAVRAHGDERSRDARIREWQQAYEVARAKRPRAGHVALTDEVGKRFKVSGRTVRKYISRPS